MKKTATFILMTVLLLSLVPTLGIVQSATTSIIADGSLNEWPASLLLADPIGDGKWGANNDIKKVGIYSDGDYIYIAGVFKKEGYNNFAAIVDLIGRNGAEDTNGHPWNRKYKLVGGDIDFMVESWENGFKAWVVQKDGTFDDVSSNVTASYGQEENWIVVELKIPLTLFGEANKKDLAFRAAFVLTGGAGGGKQWFSDIAPDQDVPTWDENGGAEEPALITKTVFWSLIYPEKYQIINENFDYEKYKLQRLIQYQNLFIMQNMFYGTRHFEKDYPRYNELDQQLRNMPLPEDAKERLDEIQNEVLDLVKLYNEGKDMITQPNYAFMGAMRIYRAYTGLKKIIGEMEEMLRKAQEGEYEHEKYMEELAKNLTKNIDGNLDDWSVKPVAVDDTGFGQDGANLKALYVDYDNQFLYIALTTENKASWRVAYGIALDYKDGGYTTGADAWGRKVSFTNGVDAQLYFFWNGEFFGDLGTSNITSAQLVLWNGTAWKYEDLKWVGFYAYTGGAQNGLQTLEIAVPWTAIGGEPEKLRIVAYVTGQGSGDSAVDVLPLQEAVKDNAPGDEWGDADTFSEFAVVTIE